MYLAYSKIKTMNKRLIIARKLVLLAKGLLDDTNISITNDGKSNYTMFYDDMDSSKGEDYFGEYDNIASKSGKYENFTGLINWKSMKGVVSNATFELKNNHSEIIVFSSGTWLKGRWKNGTWLDGTWSYGLWENGTFCKGDWFNGTWEFGEMQDGIWHDGTWEDGMWRNGTFLSGDWNNGDWQEGTWKGGKWHGGTWRNGKDKDGNQHGENDSPDKWGK